MHRSRPLLCVFASALALVPFAMGCASVPTKPPAAASVMPHRAALAGDELTDAEVAFLHASLKRSKREYTEDGLHTFVSWGLVADVDRSPEQYRLMVAGERVSASWELFVARPGGEVRQGVVFTEDEAFEGE